MPRVRTNWIIEENGYIRGKLDQILGAIILQPDGTWAVKIKASSPRRDRTFKHYIEARAYVTGLEAAQS